jgi:hypothetical protein
MGAGVSLVSWAGVVAWYCGLFRGGLWIKGGLSISPGGLIMGRSISLGGLCALFRGAFSVWVPKSLVTGPRRSSADGGPTRFPPASFSVYPGNLWRGAVLHKFYK